MIWLAVWLIGYLLVSYICGRTGGADGLEVILAPLWPVAVPIGLLLWAGFSLNKMGDRAFRQAAKPCKGDTP